MIISVSDVHLGEDGYLEQDSQFSKWLDFIRKDVLKNGGHLVLLGDIVDFWRKDSLQILQEYENAIGKLLEFPSNVDIHYVAGNHDFYMREIPEYFNASPFEFFGSTAEAGEKVTTMAKSNCRCLLMGGPFDWLVYGHTHNPFIDIYSRTINTGS
jgi:UDP-2,3-diacylglucosamine pyrophosphatase LpxH